MAALYWRVKGQGKKAIDCLRQALHYAPHQMKVSGTQGWEFPPLGPFLCPVVYSEVLAQPGRKWQKAKMGQKNLTAPLVPPQACELHPLSYPPYLRLSKVAIGKITVKNLHLIPLLLYSEPPSRQQTHWARQAISLEVNRV